MEQLFTPAYHCAQMKISSSSPHAWPFRSPAQPVEPLSPQVAQFWLAAFPPLSTAQPPSESWSLVPALPSLPPSPLALHVLAAFQASGFNSSVAFGMSLAISSQAWGMSLSLPSLRILSVFTEGREDNHDIGHNTGAILFSVAFSEAVNPQEVLGKCQVSEKAVLGSSDTHPCL